MRCTQARLRRSQLIVRLQSVMRAGPALGPRTSRCWTPLSPYQLLPLPFPPNRTLTTTVS
jgi:hypothetical protein